MTTGELSRESSPYREATLFVERALLDFGLWEAFESWPASVRADCLRWIDGAADECEEERRVTRLLDDLVKGRPLRIQASRESLASQDCAPPSGDPQLVGVAAPGVVSPPVNQPATLPETSRLTC